MGPSPRAWGRGRSARPASGGSGTIPTRVGKRCSRARNARRVSDHPHARGEECSSPKIWSSMTGPSPRAWGRAWRRVNRVRKTRTIPTRVGKRCRGRSPSRATWDHPHARGEELPEVAAVMREGGPSPRAWGRVRHSRREEHDRRTIPTRVGKRSSRLIAAALARDHPHARGEEGAPCQGAGPLLGPSPRAWGRVPRAAARMRTARTIPTRVGKSAFFVSRCLANSDHPHARGEEFWRPHSRTASVGPSPRAWGRADGGGRDERALRTIPTRVGKRFKYAAVARVIRDHPHARGEEHATLFRQAE